MKGNCIICGTETEIKMCCSGRDCGCMGQPTEPPVCSDKCEDELYQNWEKYFPTNPQQILTPLDLEPSRI